MSRQPQDPAQPTVWALYIASDDADAAAADIRTNGGTVLVDPFDIPGNGRTAVGMDPAGAAVGVSQAGGMVGAEIYNQPGGMTWEDARLSDTAAARAFYAAVFGYRYQVMEGAPGGDYTMFDIGGDPLGGMGRMMGRASWHAVALACLLRRR